MSNQGRYDSSPSLPSEGYVRLTTILQLFPIAPSTWWAGVKSGKFPPGIKLGSKTTVWRARDIRALIESFDSKAA